MALSPIERAKVWQSLDPVLRERVKNGELSIEEAGSFVVPIGDLEMQRMAAEGPGPLTASSGLDTTAPPEDPRSDTAVSLERGLLGGGQAIDTLQLGGGLEVAAANERAADVASGQRPTFAESFFTPEGRNQLMAGARDDEGKFNLTKLLTNQATNVADTIGAAVLGEDTLRGRAASATEFSQAQLPELARTREALAALPANAATVGFIEAFDSGDYVEAAKLAPAAAYYATLEQAPTLGVQAGVTATTALLTRNPAATAVAARSAGALGGLTEIGSDYESLLEEMSPEDRENPQKMLEAFRLAAKAAGVRAAVEAVAPGTGLGRTLTSKIATLTAANMASEAGGEWAAGKVMGQERSAGELALEALASGPLSAVAESGGVIRADRLANEARIDTGTGEAQQFLTMQQEADRRVGEFIKGNEEQAALDIEAEANRAIEALKMQSPTQTELPIGSDMAADPTGNDRVPTIKDMFSGEESTAPQVVERQQVAEQTATEGRMPEETDEQFEIRKQRETDARNQIDAKKQSDFEATKQKEVNRRRDVAEAETTIKQERQLLSNTGIKQEAERRLAVELEGVRNLPINRPASKRAALPKILKAYERKRKPELLEEVREQQTAKVTKARELVANQKALEDIEVENELGKRQDAKRKAEAPKETGPATDLFGDQPATELFEQPTQPSKPSFTGTLTEKQAERELAAGQLQRQKQNEKLAPAEKAKQAAALEAEIPTVSKAIEQQVTKTNNLTAKKYASSEKAALNAIVEDELTKNPKRPQEETVKAVASRMAAWRKSNPRPEAVPAPTNDDPITQKAKEVAARQETAAKTKQSRNLTEQLKAEIKKGATPQQAAETVRARQAATSNRQLTPEEEANLRGELSGKPKSTPAVIDSTFDVNGRRYRKREHTEVRVALDKAVAGNSRTKLADVLKAVQNSPDSSIGEKWLAARLAPLASNLGIQVTTDPPFDVGPTWLGAFMPDRNEIWINAADAETVLHEALHAVTKNLLDSNLRKNNPRVKKAADQLEAALEMARAEFALNPDNLDPDARISFQRLANANGGALSSMTEFVSYGLTDPGIQAWLKSIKVSGKPYSVWSVFRDAIRNLFGARTDNQRSLLDDVMEATEEMIRIQEESPAVNAWVTAAARQRAGLGFTKVASSPVLAPDPNQTETPQFKNWFKDSKVVDADGNPLIMYTGTSKDANFASFKAPGNGVWFTSDPKIASDYAKDNDSKGMKLIPGTWRYEQTNSADRVLPVYLSIQNPYITTQADHDGMNKNNYRKAQKELFDNLKRQGYDGVYMGSGTWVAFEPTQIKSAIGNNGDFATNKSNIAASQEFDEDSDFSDPTTKRSLLQLGQGKVSIKFKPEWLSSPVGTLMDALTAGGGRESITTEIFERAQSSTSALILRAEQLFRNIDYNLEQQAVEKKVDMQGYRDGFITGIQEFEKAPVGLEKKQKAKALSDKYGQAARSYFMMRRTMDNLSRDILRQRLEDPRPFTQAEAKIYRSIKENIGTYYTRVYAANTKGLGEERARKVWKEYTKRAKGDMDPEFKDGYDIVRNAAVFVRNNLLTIPDTTELETMPLVKLQKLADAWGVAPQVAADLDNPLVADTRREILIDALEKFADATPQAKDKRAIALVEDILFSRENATLTNYYRGAKQDRTIVTEREQVPEPIRKLMGEYEDLPLRAMITITRQAEFRARNKAFNELLAEEGGTRILTDEEFTDQGLSAQDWTKLNGVGYGSLDGMWVRNDLAKKLEDSAEVQRTFDQVLSMADNRPLETVMFGLRKGVEGWAKLAGFVKSIQLVWNLGNAVFNFMGGPLIQLSNGNINPKYTKRAFDTALALIEGAGGKGGQLTQDMEKVVRAGITDSAFMGEIRAVELEKLRQLTLEALRSPVEKRVSGGVQQFKAGTRRWRETYAMADVTWKIANFYAEEAKLEAYYKAEGIEKSPEAIEREAARKTNVSNFSYKRVPNLFKIGEKAGLTYIMPYIYETFRAPAGSFLIGVQDMKRAAEATTPEGKQIMYLSGAKRMIGSTLTLGIMQQMLFALTKQLAGVTDEEEEMVEDFKALLPEYKRDADFLYMGKTVDGKPVLFEFSRLDPMGPSTEFYRLLQRGAEPEEFVDTAKRLVIGNPYGTSIVKAAVGNGSTGTRLESIDPASYELVTDAVGERGAKVVDSFLPSQLVRALDPRNEGPKDDELAEALTWMGIQLHQVDPPRATQFAANQFDMAKREIKTDMYNFLKNQHNLTDEQVLSEFNDLHEREDENFEQVEKVYNGLVKVGYTPAQALALLKQKGLTDADLAQVYTGGYRPESSNLISLAGIERSWGDALKNSNMDPKVKEQYRNNLTRVLRLGAEGELPVTQE